MSESRFYVQETWGYLTSVGGGYSDPPGVSAHVLDRLYNHKPVALYRSEDEAYTKARTLDTRARAIRFANEHAARLNAEEERAASGAAR